MTTLNINVTPEVAMAIEEVRDTFPGLPVKVREDGSGGAFVIVEGVKTGPLYKQEETWVGFRITYMYPNADVYPHYVRDDLTRIDGKGHGSAIQTGQSFENRPAIQISRRSLRLNPNTDTAALKLVKVLEWLRTQS